MANPLFTLGADQKDGFLGQVSRRKDPNQVGSASTDPYIQNSHYAVIITQQIDASKAQAAELRVVVGSAPKELQMDQQIQWKSPWGAGLAGDGTVSDILAVTTGNRLVAQVTTLQVWQGASGDLDFTIPFEFRAWSDPQKDVIDPFTTLIKMSVPSLSEFGFLIAPGPLLDSEAVAEVIGKVVEGVGSAFTAGTDAFKAGGTTSNGGTSFLGLNSGTIKQVGSGINAALNNLSSTGLGRKATLEKSMKNKISVSIGKWFHMDNVVITNVQHVMHAQLPEANSGLPLSINVTVTFRPVFAVTAEDVIKMIGKQTSTQSTPVTEPTVSVYNVANPTDLTSRR